MNGKPDMTWMDYQNSKMADKGYGICPYTPHPRDEFCSYCMTFVEALELAFEEGVQSTKLTNKSLQASGKAPPPEFKH